MMRLQENLCTLESTVIFIRNLLSFGDDGDDDNEMTEIAPFTLHADQWCSTWHKNTNHTNNKSSNSSKNNNNNKTRPKMVDCGNCWIRKGLTLTINNIRATWLFWLLSLIFSLILRFPFFLSRSHTYSSSLPELFIRNHNKLFIYRFSWRVDVCILERVYAL